MSSIQGSRMLLTVGLLLLGMACGGPGDGSSPAAAAGSAAEAASASFAEHQKQFQEAQRRAEEQRLQAQALRERRRGLISVSFQEIDKEGRVVVSFTNRTGKPIDDIRGGFHAEDAQGNSLAASGYAIASPGDVFLEVDESARHRPFMTVRPEFLERLKSAPETIRFSFEAMEIRYTDGSTEPEIDS